LSQVLGGNRTTLKEPCHYRFIVHFGTMGIIKRGRQKKRVPKRIAETYRRRKTYANIRSRGMSQNTVSIHSEQKKTN